MTNPDTGRSGRGSALFELTKMRVLLFIREPEAVFWVLVFPLVLAIILGWAFKDRGPEPTSVGVVIAEANREAVLARFETVENLEVKSFTTEEEGNVALRHGRVGALWIEGSPPTLRLDPQRPEAELTRLRTLLAWVDAPPEFQLEEVEETGNRYIDWLFPGLLGMNLMGTGIWGIGFAIAEMRQKKLLRRFLVTPMRRSSFLFSFILSRGVFLGFELVVLVLFAIFVLDVPLRGSVIAFAGTCLAGTLSFAALGILIASRAQTMEGVSGIMNLVMMPMWLFSGVFFSYDRFPEAIHPFLKLLPLTALNDSLRAIMLEGAPFTEVVGPLGLLGLWCAVTFAIALRIFRWE